MSREDYEKKRKAKDKAALIYVLLSFISIVLYFPAMAWSMKDYEPTKLGLVTGIYILILLKINMWYAKEKERIENWGKKDFTLKQHIMANGEVFIGEVVHAVEREDAEYKDGETILHKCTKLIVRFFENGEEKYIVKPRFDHILNLINTEKEELQELYGEDADVIPTLKEKTIQLRQFVEDDECISFEDDGRGSAHFYEGSIEKNFKEFYTCKIYKHKNKYVVGDIEEFDYQASADLKRQKQKENYVKRVEEVEKTILILIILFLLLSIQ